MSSSPGRGIRWPAAVVLGLLALHSLSYGAGFVTDPVTGAAEFGASVPSTEAAEHLAGLVGVILLLLAVTAIVAAVLVVRGVRGGAWLTLGLGAALLSIGAYWASVGVAWDAGFYGAAGLLLVAAGAVNLTARWGVRIAR